MLNLRAVSARLRPLSQSAGVSRRRWWARPETAIFCGLLVVYGATTNSRGLYHFALHSEVVKALGEHGRLSIRDSADGQPLGFDTFRYEGRVYVRRHPGAFLLGAAVYQPVRLFGITFDRDFYLAAALVSLFTSGALTAGTGVLVYRIAKARGSPQVWATGTALAYGLGSTALPYSGTVHHDVAATAPLVGAFACRRRPFLAAILLGLSATASPLPMWMFAVLIAWMLFAPSQRGGPWHRRAAAIAAGLVLGSAALLICDWVAFGAPWRTPLTVLGGWDDTRPRFDPAMAWKLLRVCGERLILYAPIAAAGAIGLALAVLRPAPPSPIEAPDATSPKAARTTSAPDDGLILALVATHVLFVISLGTDGHCQYGPRYLLPAMPFLCLGLLGFAGRRWSGAAAGVLLVVGVGSAIINLVGALYGTMYCDPGYGFLRYLEGMSRDIFFSHPLLGIDGQLPI